MRRMIIASIIVFVSTISFAQSPVDGATGQNKTTVTYKLFPTQNMWNFIKLNTRNGLMWQVQYGLKESDRSQTLLNSEPLNASAEEVNDRYILYPTQNIYNFILLDQTDGRTWQVQWSTEPKNRGMMRIQ